MSQRKRHEVALEVVVAPHSTVFRDDEQFFVIRPPKPLDGAFIPLFMSAFHVLQALTCIH